MKTALVIAAVMASLPALFAQGRGRGRAAEPPARFRSP